MVRRVGKGHLTPQLVTLDLLMVRRVGKGYFMSKKGACGVYVGFYITAFADVSMPIKALTLVS